jgi:hypothetical protein
VPPRLSASACAAASRGDPPPFLIAAADSRVYEPVNMNFGMGLLPRCRWILLGEGTRFLADDARCTRRAARSGVVLTLLLP